MWVVMVCVCAGAAVGCDSVRECAAVGSDSVRECAAVGSDSVRRFQQNPSGMDRTLCTQKRSKSFRSLNSPAVCA